MERPDKDATRGKDAGIPDFGGEGKKTAPEQGKNAPEDNPGDYDNPDDAPPETVTLPGGKAIPKSQARQYTDADGKLHERRYSKFLDREISPQLDGILDRLQRGESVPAAEIAATEEWQEAAARQKQIEDALEAQYATRTTSEINTPEREKLRDDIIAAALADTITGTVDLPGGGKLVLNEALKPGESYQVKREKKAAIVIGLPSAGKSSAIVNPLSKAMNARVLDCDAIKQSLPEFDNGYGASAVHEESSKINRDIENRATASGDNIILPLVGGDSGKLQKRIDKLRGLGYTIDVYYNDLPAAKATGRLVARFLETGRFLQPSLIENVGDGCAKSYESAKKTTDNYAHLSNDVAFGEKPIIIEAKEGAESDLGRILEIPERATGFGSGGRPGRGQIRGQPGVRGGKQGEDRTPDTRRADTGINPRTGAGTSAENPASPGEPGAKFYRIKAADGVYIIGELKVSDADALRTSYKEDPEKRLTDPKLQNRMDDGHDRTAKIQKIAENPDPLQAAQIQSSAANGMIWTTSDGSGDVFTGNARPNGSCPCIRARQGRGNRSAHAPHGRGTRS